MKRTINRWLSKRAERHIKYNMDNHGWLIEAIKGQFNIDFGYWIHPRWLDKMEYNTRRKF